MVLTNIHLEKERIKYENITLFDDIIIQDSDRDGENFVSEKPKRRYLKFVIG